MKTKTHIYAKKTETTWEIRCIDTGGTFNTSLWFLEKFPMGYCPCCRRSIE